MDLRRTQNAKLTQCFPIPHLQVSRLTDRRNVAGSIYHVLSKPENEALYSITEELQENCKRSIRWICICVEH